MKRQGNIDYKRNKENLCIAINAIHKSEDLRVPKFAKNDREYIYKHQ